MSDLSIVDGTRVNQEIIEMLEDQLNEAKQGRILSIAVVGVSTDATTYSYYSAKRYPVTLIGEIRLLERDIIDTEIDLRMHEAATEY